MSRIVYLVPAAGPTGGSKVAYRHVEALIGLGYEPVASTPAQFATRIANDVVKFAKIIKDANIKADSN